MINILYKTYAGQKCYIIHTALLDMKIFKISFQCCEFFIYEAGVCTYAIVNRMNFRFFIKSIKLERDVSNEHIDARTCRN